MYSIQSFSLLDGNFICCRRRLIHVSTVALITRCPSIYSCLCSACAGTWPSYWCCGETGCVAQPPQSSCSAWPWPTALPSSSASFPSGSTAPTHYSRFHYDLLYYYYYYLLVLLLLLLLSFVERRIPGTSPFIDAYTYHNKTYKESYNSLKDKDYCI